MYVSFGFNELNGRIFNTFWNHFEHLKKFGHTFAIAKFVQMCNSVLHLTHWGRVTHICVSKLTIIDSDNGLSPDRRQAIIWINAGILLIGPLGTNFSEILIEILTFSSKKMRLKVSCVKQRPSCLGLNVLRYVQNCVPIWHCFLYYPQSEIWFIYICQSVYCIDWNVLWMIYLNLTGLMTVLYLSYSVQLFHWPTGIYVFSDPLLNRYQYTYKKTHKTT